MLRRRARFLTLLVSVAGLITLGTTQETKGGRYDQQIQEDVERVLQSNPRIQNVHAITEDAIVTLSGTVKLYIDKLDIGLGIMFNNLKLSVKNGVATISG